MVDRRTGWLCFEITRDDVRRHAFAMRAREWKRSGSTPVARALALAGWACGTVLLALAGWATARTGGLGWLSALSSDPLLRGLISVLVLVACLVGLTLVAGPWLDVWRASRRRDVLGPRRIRIGVDGVHVVTQNLTSVVGWGGIARVEDSLGDVQLFLDDSAAILVPARAFAAAADRDAFVDECRLRAAADRITCAD